MLENAKAIEPVVGSLRARALSRAQATAAVTPIDPAPQTLRERWPVLRLGMVAVVMLVLGATGAVAAFLRHPTVRHHRARVDPARPGRVCRWELAGDAGDPR